MTFTAAFEGVCPYLYLDNIGLVTTGIGNLVDPIEHALTLPFYRPDGSLATPSEIAAAWRAVKARTDLAMRGGTVFARVTALRLTPEGIQRLVVGKLAEMNGHLVTRLGKAYTDAPADGQLALLSMAWAAGPYFPYPRLIAAVKAGDWETASEECELRAAVVNASLRERNRANRVLFRNAGRVIGGNLDPEQLYWPQDLAASLAAEEHLSRPASSPDEDDEAMVTVTDLRDVVQAGIEAYRRDRGEG
ncbi:MAG TPA: hypothetical protein VEA38_24805 [Terriglobales bacterium]|nr:hypothetical protein [Terriglobales bacterium]